ncbi:MAG: CooT family nickel-binding protein [Lachnospiraceae bacterium]|nr:CooT family nickel-binding protein [Lachnospiraceae bacterium]
MCLSNVYLIKPNEEKELVGKNIASISFEGGELILKNVLGIPTKIKGEISHVDLVENFVYVRPTPQ